MFIMQLEAKMDSRSEPWGETFIMTPDYSEPYSSPLMGSAQVAIWLVIVESLMHEVSKVGHLISRI